MNDTLQALVPGAIAAAVGLLSAAAARFLAGLHWLRRGLQDDAAVVETLHGDAKADLQTDMARRASQLVATSRYPLLTGVDLALIVFVLLAMGVALASTFPLLDERVAYFDIEAVASTGLIDLTLAGPIWYFVSRGWARRAQARLAYLRARLDADDYAQFSLSTRILTFLLRAGAQVVITGSVCTAWVIATRALHEPSGVAIGLCLFSLGLVIITAVTTNSLGKSKDLDAMLPRLQQTVGIGAMMEFDEPAPESAGSKERGRQQP